VTKKFEQRLRMMYSRDGMTAEEGFADLLAHVKEHTEDLIAAFHAELASPEPNLAMRSWLLELISESRSDAALPTLVEQLYSLDHSLSFWARCGLEKLDTKQARIEVWKARFSGVLKDDFA
jgi:hypothetical protein